MSRGQYIARKKARLLEQQAHRCAYCLCELEFEAATLDHIIPRCFGGKHADSNIVVACSPCNHARGNRNAWTFWKHRKRQREANAYPGVAA